MTDVDIQIEEWPTVAEVCISADTEDGYYTVVDYVPFMEKDFAGEMVKSIEMLENKLKKAIGSLA